MVYHTCNIARGGVAAGGFGSVAGFELGCRVGLAGGVHPDRAWRFVRKSEMETIWKPHAWRRRLSVSGDSVCPGGVRIERGAGDGPVRAKQSQFRAGGDRPETGGNEQKSTKSEARNAKQIPNTKLGMLETLALVQCAAWDFGSWVIRACFGFRDSIFVLPAGCGPCKTKPISGVFGARNEVQPEKQSQLAGRRGRIRLAGRRGCGMLCAL